MLNRFSSFYVFLRTSFWIKIRLTDAKNLAKFLASVKPISTLKRPSGAPKTTLKRPSEVPKTSQKQPHDAPEAIFGKKNLSFFCKLTKPKRVPKHWTPGNTLFYLFFRTTLLPFLYKTTFGVDFELPNWPSNPQKYWFYYGNPYIFENRPKKTKKRLRGEIKSISTLPRPSSAAKSEQTNPSESQDESRRFFFYQNAAPNSSQNTPKIKEIIAQEGPKTLSKPSLVKTLHFFKNIGNPIIKSTFSMIETWVWELEIGKKSCPKNNVEL